MAGYLLKYADLFRERNKTQNVLVSGQTLGLCRHIHGLLAPTDSSHSVLARTLQKPRFSSFTQKVLRLFAIQLWLLYLKLCSPGWLPKLRAILLP